MILAFKQDNQYDFRMSEERTVLTEHTINNANIVAAYDSKGASIYKNSWLMKKHLSREDHEACETVIQEFADNFYKHVASSSTTKDRSEKEQSFETKKRRHSTDPEEEEQQEPQGDRSVKPKVKIYPPLTENVIAFNEDFAQVYLDRDTTKAGAAEEFQEHKEKFIDFMERLYNNPKSLPSDLTECEKRSLWHVDPSKTFKEEEFYFYHKGKKPTMQEFRDAQHPTGYPIKIPIGLKKLTGNDDPSVIKAFTDILGSLTQASDRGDVDRSRHDFNSSSTLNILTVNFGDLTRNRD